MTSRIAVGYSEPQISYLETNRRLPDVATVAARFLPVLDLGDVPALGQRLVELAQAARCEADPAPGLPPFKGLQYYEEADAALFFGREELTARLVARLAPDLPGGDGLRFLAVVGASGSGKSSVLRAGVAPALKRRAGTARSVCASSRPPLTRCPLSTSARQAGRQTSSSWTSSKSCSPCARTPESRSGSSTRCSPRAAARRIRRRSLRALGGDRRCGPTSTPSAREYAELREALAQHQEYIGPMNAAELRRAIEEPARAGGWEFEPGLVDLMLRDTGDEPGAPAAAVPCAAGDVDAASRAHADRERLPGVGRGARGHRRNRRDGVQRRARPGTAGDRPQHLSAPDRAGRRHADGAAPRQPERVDLASGDEAGAGRVGAESPRERPADHHVAKRRRRSRTKR